jgi:hypothetical protein
LVRGEALAEAICCTARSSAQTAKFDVCTEYVRGFTKAKEGWTLHLASGAIQLCRNTAPNLELPNSRSLGLPGRGGELASPPCGQCAHRSGTKRRRHAHQAASDHALRAKRNAGSSWHMCFRPAAYGSARLLLGRSGTPLRALRRSGHAHPSFGSPALSRISSPATSSTPATALPLQHADPRPPLLGLLVNCGQHPAPLATAVLMHSLCVLSAV